MIAGRRVLRVVVLVTVVAVAYVGGVVTGVVGAHDTPASARRSGVLDQAAARIEAKAAHPLDRAALQRAAVEGMLRALGDRYSTYYGKTQYASFRSALEGHYSGVGLWLRAVPRAAALTREPGGVEVGSVAPASPAQRAGVQAGDALLRIGRHDVSTADEPRVAALLRGTPGSVVVVTLRRGSATRTVHLTRASFSADDVTVERLAGGITRIAVTAFTRGVGRDVAQAMRAETSRHPRGVVLDLRDDPGGLLDEAVSVASVFLDGGPVVTYERRGAAPRTLDAFRGGDTTTPLVVLVNPATASAAEVVAGALQDRNRAVVVGTRTYGKGSVQEPTQLSDGSALELTVGHYLTPSGRSLDGVGIEPDVLVPPGVAPEVAERRAIDVITGLVAAIGGPTLGHSGRG